MLRNAAIRQLLLILLVPLVVTLVGRSALSAWVMSSARSQLRSAIESDIAAYTQLSDLVIELGANQQRYQLLSQQEIRQIPFETIVYEVFRAQDALQQQVAVFVATRQKYDLSAEEQDLITKLQEDLQAYHDANKTVEDTYFLFDRLNADAQQLLMLALTDATTSLAEVSRAFSRATTLDTVVGLVVLIAIVALGIITSRAIQRPLRRLEGAINEIASGDGDLSRRLEFATQKSEVGRVAIGFNDFVHKLHGIVFDVRGSLDGLRDSAGELVDNSEQTASAITQVDTSMSNIATQIETQYGYVAGVRNASDDIIKRIAALSDQINEQSDAVTQSSASIEQMVANIQSVTNNLRHSSEEIEQLVTASKAGQEMLSNTLAMIRTITEQSDALRSTNTIISDLSERTNLLAMNAAIEAAHAGELGRGFAVVAGEIRSLAENSNQQSRSIRERLESINETIDQVSEQSSGVDRAFTDVGKRIETVTRLNGEVLGSMQEQTAGSQQILEALQQVNVSTTNVRELAAIMRERSGGTQDAIADLSRVSDHVRVAVEEINVGTKQISAAAEHVRQLTDQNRDLIEAANRSIRQFRVAAEDHDSGANAH